VIVAYDAMNSVRIRRGLDGRRGSAGSSIGRMEAVMKRNRLLAAAALGLGLVVGAGGMVSAQSPDDKDGWRWPFGPRHMWDDDWGRMGRGRFGPGMMGFMGPGMMPMMFVMMDTNGDGAVSFEEMEAVHKRMFDLVDKNKDGKVTLDELREVMGAPGEKD
jgi:hypothetical protein